MTNLAAAISAGPSGQIQLDGRVAIVTGAARGLGRAIAIALSDHGAKLALIDLRSTGDTAALLAGPALGLEVDVADRAATQRAIADIDAAWGRIDILVNNAGMGGRVGLADIEDEMFDRQVAVNLKAAMYWTQAAAPVMARLGGGKIVNISSISARVGGVDSSNPVTGGGRSGPIYAAAKGGVLAFTRWAARELGPAGILVNAICPGPTATDATAGYAYDLDGLPIPTLGQPEDVAYATLFLASQMSNHVTGQTLNVDGGLRMD